MKRWTTVLLAALLSLNPARGAFALIRGDVGNKLVADPGWPKGASALFNHSGRVAWWEGPPFGGGQWHAECRGDARTLNAVLADFARLDVKSRKVFIHDGVGHSFWLAPNREPEKLAAAKVDWTFMVWQSASWDRLRNLPADLNPTDPRDDGPPSHIDVFTGGIRWADVVVPEGIEVVDQRLEAHGFTPADGVVIEAKVVDLATRRPIAATLRLQRVEPQKQGGYLYPVVAEARADAQGRCVLKNAPMGWFRVAVEAEGFVPRVLGHAQFDDQPRWQFYEGVLAQPATVSGRVVDDAGKPLADVDVRLDNVQDEARRRYESTDPFTFKTDAQGRFRAERVPVGKSSIWLHKPGYIRPGLGLPITVPQADIELKMTASSGLRVTVDFAGKARPEGYIVNLKPEGGEVIGSYGGSGQIDAQNRMNFENVPPGRYVLTGQPNPSSGDQTTAPVTVEVKGGQVAEVMLKAK